MVRLTEELTSNGQAFETDPDQVLLLLRERNCLCFQNMGDGDLVRLCELIRGGHKYKEKDMVCPAGVMNYMYMVYQGSLNVLDSNEVSVAKLGVGRVIGEASLISQEAYPNTIKSGPQGVVLVHISYEALTATKTDAFFNDLLEQQVALSEVAVALKKVYDPNLSIPTEIEVPSWDTFKVTKSGKYPEIVAMYRRLKSRALQARLGAGHKFFRMQHPNTSEEGSEATNTDNDSNSDNNSNISLDKAGLRAHTCFVKGSMPGSPKWSSLRVAPDLPASGQAYIEFVVEQLGGRTCEVLLGICDAASPPPDGTPAWKSKSAWMYYGSTGRVYTNGFGEDFAKHRPEGRVIAQGDVVGLLVDVRERSTLSNPLGSSASIFINGESQGAFVSSKSLSRSGLAWPSSIAIYVDMHGDSEQRIRLNPDRVLIVPPDGVPFTSRTWNGVKCQWQAREGVEGAGGRVLGT